MTQCYLGATLPLDARLLHHRTAQHVAHVSLLSFGKSGLVGREDQQRDKDICL